MTSFSKSCQIELFSIPTMIMCEIEGRPLPYTEHEFLPCADKAKHSLTIKSLTISNRRTLKLKLCEFHFKYLQQYYEELGGSAKLVVRFKRNRL